MRIYQKLLLGFALVALLVGCVGYVGQLMNRRMERGVLQLSESVPREVAYATEMESALRESESAAHHLLQRRPDAAEALRAALERFEANLVLSRGAAAALRQRGEAGGQRPAAEQAARHLALLDRLSAAFRLYQESAESFAEQARTDRAAAGALFEGTLLPQVQGVLLPALAQYRESARAAFDANAAEVRDRIVQADRLFFVAVLLAIGLTLVLGVLIAQSIAGPLNVLVQATRSIGRGRFQHRVRVGGAVEVKALSNAFNAMAEELSRTTVSKRFLDDILRSMADPLVVTSTEGAVRLANRAVHDALGYAEGALEGEPVERLFAEADAAQAALADALRSGYAGSRETAFRTEDGEALPVAFSAALLRDGEGEVQGVVWVAKDVTEQKRFEDELVRAKEEAEAVSRLKSNFLANMSHEIRTPLNGILGASQVLASMLEGEERELVGIIDQAGHRLLGTINSVLDMARIEAGQLRPTPEPLALAAEARDAVGVLRGMAERKRLTLRVEEAAADVWVAADQGFLHRVLDNLIGNAIKFTRAGGVTVEVSAEAEWGVLRVRDTGIGIDPKFLPHLFDEFKQESTGIGRSHEGSGLGLAITHRLVSLLGGEIAVESVKGAGSTFTVRLPRADAPSPAGRARPRKARVA